MITKRCHHRRLALAVITVFACSCTREPDLRWQSGDVAVGNQMTPRRVGPPPVARMDRRVDDDSLDDEALVSEGQQLYQQFNCAGCHASGGGAIGPALSDAEWIYGSTPANVYWTIVEGRPQGMPAFGGRIAEGQLWKIVTYVRSLSSSLRDEAPADRARPDPDTPLADSSIARGREVFLQGACALCHTIRGTPALATVGPDLTHVASRGRLAAGTLPNTRGHLAGWILNPQNLKPGTKMPPTLLNAGDLHALLDYLETLQ